MKTMEHPGVKMAVPERPVPQEHHYLAHARKYLGYLALAAGGAGIVLGGGVLGTQVAPHTTSVDGIEITTKISPNIYERGKIFMQTPAGSIDVDSKYSFAPGIEVSPEITTQGAGQFGQWLQRMDNPVERGKVLNTIVDDQASNLAWRFGIGAGVTAIGLAGAYELYKRRGDRSLSRAATAGAVGIAIGLTELTGIGVAYYDSNVNALHATGILARAIGTPDTLRGIDSIQTNELLPYLNGWLSLGKLAQAKIAAPEKETPTAISLLFVSDIHGRNRYALMKDVIEQQHIDAVVDTGDLINFGFPQELALTNLPASVKSLGVPYLYVTGNHDSQGPDDFSVIQALKKGAPNVIPLQPNATTYNEVSIGGYTIAGMDDRGHYYTDGIDNETDAMQTPYAKLFNKAFQGISLDLIAAHEPSAIAQITGGIFTANGHTHKAAFADNNINPGTFTGGDELRSAGSYADALSEFQQCKAQTKNAEGCTSPSEKPSSYAVLSIGEDCRPNTLTIYQYIIGNGHVTNTVVSAYDLSGMTRPDANRACDMARGVSVQVVQTKN